MKEFALSILSVLKDIFLGLLAGALIFLCVFVLPIHIGVFMLKTFGVYVFYIPIAFIVLGLLGCGMEVRNSI